MAITRSKHRQLAEEGVENTSEASGSDVECDADEDSEFVPEEGEEGEGWGAESGVTGSDIVEDSEEEEGAGKCAALCVMGVAFWSR